MKALQTIESSGTHLLELINDILDNDILDVAKIESGQLELSCTPTAVVPLCQSSLAFIKPLAQKKRIQLKTKLPQNLPELLVDERRIRQVLINLLNNAVKFTPDAGSVSLEVQASPLNENTTDSQNFLRIAVIDNGIGIAPENINKLFQPFVQIDSSLNRHYHGTGLGLSLVKRIVEHHGGQVGVSSEFGVGSCFTVDLPYTDTILFNPKLESHSEANIKSTQAQQEAAPLILLAEDNEVNITIISSYLKAKRYRIILAKNGDEAIAQAESQNPDLILMDISMQKKNGLEAIQHIRHTSHLVDLPIVALTALAMEGDRERCLAAGANDYLSKPVKLKQLVTMIQELLATKENSK